MTVPYFFTFASALSSHNNSWVHFADFPAPAELGYDTTSEIAAPASTFSEVGISSPLGLSSRSGIFKIPASPICSARRRCVAASCYWYFHDPLMQWQANVCLCYLWLLYKSQVLAMETIWLKCLLSGSLYNKFTEPRHSVLVLPF